MLRAVVRPEIPPPMIAMVNEEGEGRGVAEGMTTVGIAMFVLTDQGLGALVALQRHDLSMIANSEPDICSWRLKKI